MQIIWIGRKYAMITVNNLIKIYTALCFKHI